MSIVTDDPDYVAPEDRAEVYEQMARETESSNLARHYRAQANKWRNQK